VINKASHEQGGGQETAQGGALRGEHATDATQSARAARAHSLPMRSLPMHSLPMHSLPMHSLPMRSLPMEFAANARVTICMSAMVTELAGAARPFSYRARHIACELAIQEAIACELPISHTSYVAYLVCCCVQVHRPMRWLGTWTDTCMLGCGRYVLDMGRYDMDFDIRDRARMMRAILVADHSPLLRDKAHALFLSSRQPPEFVAPSKGKGAFVLNTLSHVVSHQVPQLLMSPNSLEPKPTALPLPASV